MTKKLGKAAAKESDSTFTNLGKKAQTISQTQPHELLGLSRHHGRLEHIQDGHHSVPQPTLLWLHDAHGDNTVQPGSTPTATPDSFGNALLLDLCAKGTAATAATLKPGERKSFAKLLTQIRDNNIRSGHGAEDVKRDTLQRYYNKVVKPLIVQPNQRAEDFKTTLDQIFDTYKSLGSHTEATDDTARRLALRKALRSDPRFSGALAALNNDVINMNAHTADKDMYLFINAERLYDDKTQEQEEETIKVNELKRSHNLISTDDLEERIALAVKLQTMQQQESPKNDAPDSVRNHKKEASGQRPRKKALHQKEFDARGYSTFRCPLWEEHQPTITKVLALPDNDLKKLMDKVNLLENIAGKQQHVMKLFAEATGEPFKPRPAPWMKK